MVAGTIYYFESALQTEKPSFGEGDAVVVNETHPLWVKVRSPERQGKSCGLGHISLGLQQPMRNLIATPHATPHVAPHVAPYYSTPCSNKCWGMPRILQHD